MTRSDIPHKVNAVLHLVLIAFLLIAFRVWYLGTIKHDEYLEKALKPQRRSVVEVAPRGTIRDRFGIPLAMNKVQYNVAVCYDRIRDIPLVTWDKNEEGKKVKHYARRRHVESLAKMLGKHLEMDPVAIEDLIYSKASIFPRTPFVIREDIDEGLYYRLRMMEKDWTGLKAERGTKRYYPQGKVGSDIVGYMGAINERQYLAVAQEINELTLFLEEREEGLPVPLPKGFYSAREVELRLLELKEKAYTIHAQVGKVGIERKCDEELRGMYGKREVELGARGRFIRNLPGGKTPTPGDQICLAISSELQAFAEELLILNEQDREKRFPLAGKDHDKISSPWIKGGAIVAMIPESGEVVALASYPRFDSNDFNRKEKTDKIYQWLESPRHIGAIWDGFAPMQREFLTYTEKEFLSWEKYLDLTLSKNCQVKKALWKVLNIGKGVHLQYIVGAIHKLMEKEKISETIDTLYPKVPLSFPIDEMRKEIDPYLLPIKLNSDKLLFLDLLRLIANGENFSKENLSEVQGLSLPRYREISQAFALIKKEVTSNVKALYHEKIFPLWREKNFKVYLKQKRKEEKEKKTYPHPYTDYLAEAEGKLFQEFWKTHRSKFFDAFIRGNIACETSLQPFLFHLSLKSKELEGSLLEALEKIRKESFSMDLLNTFCSFDELKSPLWGRYPSLTSQTLQGLAKAFYPRNGYGYGKSFAYGRSAPLGSIFKLVTGYEALKQHYFNLEEKGLAKWNLSPLEIIDEMSSTIVTDHGIVLGRYLNGKFITRYHKGGRLPRSHSKIGKVDFRTALERSSNIYFSLLAGEVINHPSDLEKTTHIFGFGKKAGLDLYGEFGGYVPDDLRDNKTGLYSFAIGQHSLSVTPLQTTIMLAAIGNGGYIVKPQILKGKGVEVKRTLPMPTPVRKELLEGMRRVVKGERGPVQPYRIRTLYEHPKWIPEYKALQGQFIGKTSTAEFVYRPTLDREGGPLICKDIWFGALSFKEGDDYLVDMPELAVVIYLKFGDYGKEAAPLAAQIIKKWREICAKNTSLRE